MARTDYIVNGKRDAAVFLTAAKSAGGEGRPFMARTLNGGLSWKFVSWIAPDPGAGGQRGDLAVPEPSGSRYGGQERKPTELDPLA